MAFIYEVNGQRVEFEKEPTDKDIDEAARSLGAKPESQMPKPVEGAGGAAFGVYRPQGRRPESQNDREASKEMPIQTARGLVTGSLGAPADILNLPGQLYGMATNQPAPYRIPLGSEDFNQLLPGQSDTPQARLARFGGEALAPVPTIKGAKAIAQVPGQVYQTGKEFTQGAMEGLRNPTYQRTAETAFAPLEKTYYPTPEVQAFQNTPAAQRPGMLPNLEASQLPSESLFSSPSELLARALGPKTQSGQTLIPFQGQTTKAFGETVGRDIATAPFKSAGLPSIAGATIGGIAGGPIGAMIGAGAGAAINPLLRAAELYSLNKLGKTAGFTKGFPEQLAQAQGRAGIQGQMPQTPLLTNQATGPVNPSTMYVAPEGVAGTNINQVSQAGAQQKYAPQPVAQTPQQMALQKTQQIVNQNQPKTTTPVVTTPAPKVQAQPVAQTTTRSSDVINKELTALDNEMTNLRDTALENRITPDTPEGVAYSNQLNEMANKASTLQKELELAKKAEKSANKKSSKSAPSNVSKMMTPEDTFKALQQDVPRSEMGATEGKIFDMKQAERDVYEKKLKAQLMTPGLYPMDKQLLENALKLIDKYRFK